MKYSLFHCLIDQGFEINSILVKSMRLEKGYLIYQPPQYITPIFEIINGVVKIGSYSIEGVEVCYDILKPGDFFGNLQYLNGQFSEFSKTLTAAEVRAYDLDYFKQLVTNHPKLSDWFNKELVNRWCRAEERLYAVRSLSAVERVKRILPYFEEEIADASGRKFDLLKLITFQDIADLTGLSRQTVSKVMQQIMPPNKKQM